MTRNLVMVLVPVQFSVLLSGCLSSGAVGALAADPSSSAAPASVGKSCKGKNQDQLCLGVKYVVYKDSRGKSIVSPQDADSNLRDINHIWNQCKIGFQFDSYNVVDPSEAKLQYDPADSSELSDIRKTYEDGDSFLVVTTGTWDRSGSLGDSGANAWTSMPGDDLYGVVLERPVATDGNIFAHELGHYLNLLHVSDSTDLMNPIIYGESKNLSRDQCETARDSVRSYWQRMLRS